jgi:hypothetical protein
MYATAAALFAAVVTTLATLACANPVVERIDQTDHLCPHQPATGCNLDSSGHYHLVKYTPGEGEADPHKYHLQHNTGGYDPDGQGQHHEQHEEGEYDDGRYRLQYAAGHYNAERREPGRRRLSWGRRISERRTMTVRQTQTDSDTADDGPSQSPQSQIVEIFEDCRPPRFSHRRWRYHKPSWVPSHFRLVGCEGKPNPYPQTGPVRIYRRNGRLRFVRLEKDVNRGFVRDDDDDRATSIQDQHHQQNHDSDDSDEKDDRETYSWVDANYDTEVRIKSHDNYEYPADNLRSQPQPCDAAGPAEPAPVFEISS